MMPNKPKVNEKGITFEYIYSFLDVFGEIHFIDHYVLSAYNINSCRIYIAYVFLIPPISQGRTDKTITNFGSFCQLIQHRLNVES